MDALSFLKALPAILGIVGFFAYLWAGQSRIGGDLMSDIVQKLRTAPNVTIQDYTALTPARIAHLIKEDAAVRSALNAEDTKIIRLIIILQSVITVIVLLVCAALVGVGIWLISRPEPLSIVPLPPISALAEKSEALIDLDPLKAQWEASGTVETITVFLENVDSNARSDKKNISADVRTVEFTPDEVHKVATNREYHGKNRVRTVIEWPGHTVRSVPTDLLVGIRVQLMIGGTFITPEGSRPINHLIATIDDSTEHMPHDYCFTANLVGWRRMNALIAPLRSCNLGGEKPHGEVDLPFLADIDWNRHVGLTFDQPLVDRSLARLCISAPQLSHNQC